MELTEFQIQVEDQMNIKNVVGTVDDAVRAMLAWGWGAAQFWTDPQRIRVFSRDFMLDHLTDQAVDQLLAGPADRAVEEQRMNQGYQRNHPLTGAEVIDHALHKGSLIEVSGRLQVPEKAALRHNAQGKQAAQPDREASAGGAGGWATLGMYKSHRNETQKGVKYLSDAERGKKVLRLVRGQFVDSAGQLAHGPQFSQKSYHQLSWAERREIWESNPAAANAMYQSRKNRMTEPRALQETIETLRNDPRLIFVMTEGGQFLAAQGKQDVFHHSSLLAGGAVAAAGELGLRNGKPVVISNESGHYRPGPAYLWQAVRQMQLQGVDVDNLRVEIHNCAPLSGRQFLDNFDPSAPATSPKHLSFDEAAAERTISAWSAAQQGGTP